MRFLSACLMLAFVASACAQQAPSLPKQAAAVRQKVAHLAANAPISVIRVSSSSHSLEEYGKFLSAEQNTFTFYDIDIKKDVTLSYNEVSKVKDGYGGYNFVRHRHTDRTRGIVVTAIVLGALVALTAAAVAAR